MTWSYLAEEYALCGGVNVVFLDGKSISLDELKNLCGLDLLGKEVRAARCPLEIKLDEGEIVIQLSESDMCWGFYNPEESAYEMIEDSISNLFWPHYDLC